MIALDLSTNARLYFKRRRADGTSKLFYTTGNYFVKPGVWHHVAITWNQKTGNARIFLDGEEAGYSKWTSGAEWKEDDPNGYRLSNKFIGEMEDLYFIKGDLDGSHFDTFFKGIQ